MTNASGLPRPGVFAVVATFVLLYAKVFADLCRNWARDPNYSHGFLILPLIASLVWQRRAQLATVQSRPTDAGLWLIGFSVVVLLVGTAGVEYFLMRVSMVGVVVGVILYLSGWAMLRALAFPLLFS